MSFSTEVKEELSRQMGGARHCQIAELSALIIFCGTIRMDEETVTSIELRSEHGAVVDKYMLLLKKCFRVTPHIDVLEPGQKRRRRQYIITITDETIIRDMLLAMSIMKKDGTFAEEQKLSHRVILQKNCCRRAFLRGAFLAAGSISDPNRSYHYEIVCDTEDLAEQLSELMQSLGIDARYVRRNRYEVVYVKESEQISDLLTLMDARVSILNFENIRIIREMRGNVNRKVNCETANINKTASAAVRQIEDIRYIESRIGLSALPDGLDETARVRLQYPVANLRELGELMDPPVGKSGVNHRLRKLSRIADDLRRNKEAVIND